MKAKRVFLTVGLSLVMAGSVAAAGLLGMSKDLKPAKALTTTYLKPGVWSADNAWFAAYSFKGSDSHWDKMVAADAGYYKADLDTTTYDSVIFVRMNSSKTALSWDSKWNQTSDLSFAADKNCYEITGWNAGDGQWTSHTETAPSTYS